MERFPEKQVAFEKDDSPILFHSRIALLLKKDISSSPNALAVLLLGSNMGDRAGYLDSAVRGLEATCGRIIQKSFCYESAAWGDVAQRDFLNLAVVLETTLSPGKLLHCCQQIEKAHDRARTGKWHPRTLDIDIIFYNNQVVDLPELKIPHPLLAERRFVLAPLAEIIPAYVHPQLEQSVADLLAACEDSGKVWLWKA